VGLTPESHLVHNVCGGREVLEETEHLLFIGVTFILVFHFVVVSIDSFVGCICIGAVVLYIRTKSSQSGEEPVRAP